MKILHKLASLFLIGLLLFIPLRSVSASGLLDGRVIFGQTYTLKSGETLSGDLVVIGGSAEIEAGATVQGNLILIGGTLTIDGTVSGEVAVLGGEVTLGAASRIGSNLTTVGAVLTRAEGSQVDGQINNAATSWEDDTNGAATTVPDDDQAPETNIWVDFKPMTAVMNAIWEAVGMAALAMVVTLFLAPQAGRVAQAVTNQVLIAGTLGLMTLIVVPIVVVMLSLTVFLIPVALVVGFAAVIAAVFGWIAIGYELGVRFTRAIHQEWHPALSAGLGTFILSLVASALTAIPVLSCIGGVVPLLVGLIALGGVVMTRFGTQAVTPRTPMAPAAPSVPDSS